MKKLLALVLALVMTMSLVTISNAAFTDADKIEHTEAVDVMNALGVIAGMPDGSFAPKGNVTRAQMAKMITIIMLGDVDPAAFVGTTTDLKDITGHWAEGYIKYCYSQGVIAGKGNGIFDPDANVTAVEAAKMLLVAIGYDADVQGYVGGDWAINIIRDAQISKLFEELSVTSTQVLTRDEAAQMIYNAINAKMIEKEPSINITNGQVTYTYKAGSKTLLNETFDVIKAEGTLDSFDYDSDEEEFEYNICVDYDSQGQKNIYEDYYTEADYTDLFAQNVEVLYKVEKSRTTVYGIYAKDSAVVVEGIIGDISNLDKLSDTTDEVKVDGTKYKVDVDKDGKNSITGAYAFGAASTTSFRNIAKMDGYKAFTFKAIDNDDNGKIDTLVFLPFTVEEVKYVGTKSFTTANNYKFEDVDVYEGVEKNDWVKVTAAANTATNTALFEKLDEVSAKATAVKKTDGKIMFNGEWFNVTDKQKQTTTAGADCKYVAVNGYLFNLESDGSVLGTADYVVVVKQADAAAGLDKTWTTKLLKSDGTTVTVEATAEAIGGSFFTYEVDDDGYYVLTLASSKASETDFDVVVKDTATFNVATSKKDGYITYHNDKYYIDDDAVVFVKDSSGDYSVTTGAKLKATNKSISVWYFAADKDSSSGYSYVKLALVGSDSLGKTSELYAYVTGDVVKYQDADDENKYYVEIPFGDETLTTKSTTAARDDVVDKAYKLAKGDIIKYELNGDGKVDSITKYSMSALAANATDFTAAIVAVEGDDIRFSNNYFKADGTVESTVATLEATLTDDSVIIYVDGSENTVEEGGAIQKAVDNKVDDITSNYANAMAVVDDNDEILLLVVDVNNDILDVQ